jgi:hypothetical protein
MTVRRALPAGIAAGVVVVGAGVIAAHPTAPSLPDVEVPAVELSNSEGMNPTAVWLDLMQASGNNADSLGTKLPDPGPAAEPGQVPLVVIDPQDNPSQNFEGILDGVVGNMGNPLDAVNSAINGPDAVNYLILNGGS